MSAAAKAACSTVAPAEHAGAAPDAAADVPSTPLLALADDPVSNALAEKGPERTEVFSAVLGSLSVDSSASSPLPSWLAAPPPQLPVSTAAVAAAVTATAAQALAQLPVTHADWPAALGHHLLWNVGEGVQKAELSVSPQDMGPINVHIRIDNDKADIRFTATHVLTRDALESSIPKLREMFAQQGLDLGQAQVFSQTPQDARPRQPSRTAGPAAVAGGESAEDETPQPLQAPRWRRGLVDDYA